MQFRQTWLGRRDGEDDWFSACVPGNIQKDYAAFRGWGDVNYGNHFEQYAELESSAWYYRTELVYSKAENEKVFFVSGGIDYRFSVFLNGTELAAQEGMFTPIDIELTPYLKAEGNCLEVKIYPHPMREDAPIGREQADNCCKPPVSYGWDWHPRVIPSGIWNDAYIETRSAEYIVSCEPFYTLSEDFRTACVHFEVECTTKPQIQLFSPEGECLYCGTETDIVVENPKLWWCNGHGEPALYRWTVQTQDDEKTGRIGFRHVELVMNEGTEDEGNRMPKTQRFPPITVCLNGRRIFAKGTNWVNPEIFTGSITRETYEPLVRLAKDANMNIFRCWGGAGANKKDFYELCDEMGIMVWQEFPLACNDYKNDAHYLEILEREARSIVRGLRSHPSVIMWCGGNELFNSWSGMTMQSHALRLLDKVCYEEDRNRPYLPTSPVMGMGHGTYLFYLPDVDEDVYQLYQNSHCTAYTEFGVPGTPSAEYLRSFIPPEELFPPKRGTTWETHHAFGAWDMDETTWLCLTSLERYFGSAQSLEQLCEQSEWLQCEGYKAIYEEARRQSPYCSMALNWCYNEPWKTAANNSIVSYPAHPKKAYFAVRDALRATMPSAKFSKFAYGAGECFRAELWLLNDSAETADDEIIAEIEIAGKCTCIGQWKSGAVRPFSNRRGQEVSFVLPECKTDRFTLILRTQHSGESRYTLRYSSQ